MPKFWWLGLAKMHIASVVLYPDGNGYALHQRATFDTVRPCDAVKLVFNGGVVALLAMTLFAVDPRSRFSLSREHLAVGCSVAGSQVVAEADYADQTADAQSNGEKKGNCPRAKAGPRRRLVLLLPPCGEFSDTVILRVWWLGRLPF